MSDWRAYTVAGAKINAVFKNSTLIQEMPLKNATQLEAGNPFQGQNASNQRCSYLHRRKTHWMPCRTCPQVSTFRAVTLETNWNWQQNVTAVLLGSSSLHIRSTDATELACNLARWSTVERKHSMHTQMYPLLHYNLSDMNPMGYPQSTATWKRAPLFLLLTFLYRDGLKEQIKMPVGSPPF